MQRVQGSSTTDVSVVVCTRDRSDMLRRCLTSLLAGAALPGEILVVDQSTDDRSAEVVRSLPEIPACPIRYLRTDTVGLAIARNIGAKAARGKFVAFTDDDCTADPKWVEAIDREFADASANCVCGHVYPADHTERPREARISTLNHRQRKVLRGKCNPFTLCRGNNMAFRKADILSLGGFNESIGVGTSVFAGEDLDMIYRLMEVGGCIIHTPHAVVRHAQPDEFGSVLKKKRGYSIAASAILVARIRYGDAYAGLLLLGKMLYEAVYLLLGGVCRLNPCVSAVGWHSVMGSLSGLKYAFDPAFNDRTNSLTSYARETFRGVRTRSKGPGTELRDHVIAARNPGP